MNHADLTRLMQNAMARLRLPFRGILHRTDTAPGNPLMQMSGLAGETSDKVEMMQQFGFTSSPPAGSQCVIIPLGGKSAHSIIIATENGAHRIRELKEGEVILYNAHGDTVRLLKDGLIEINCKRLIINATENVQINSPAVTTSGTLHADGSIDTAANLTAQGNVADQGGAKTMAEMRKVYNAHQRTPPTSM